MLYAISYALDNVEREYRGIGLYHADRVAYIAVQMGRAAGIKTESLVHLAAAAVLLSAIAALAVGLFIFIPKIMSICC